MDENTLSHRVGRYAKVSTAIGSLGVKLAGEKFLGIGIDRNNHAEDLKKILGNLKGPMMKVAQILATIPDQLPPEYIDEFLTLQANAPSMGPSFVRRRMASELGPDWQSKFQTFDMTPCNAASLGQVHKAVSLDGAPIAIKLQYPNMEGTLEADLNQLKWALEIFKKITKAINPDDVFCELKDRLWEELDYELEAKNIKLYQQFLKDAPYVRVPQVYPELSTKRLLTMEWLEGMPFMTMMEKTSQDQKNKVAEHLFLTWYTPFYTHGVIHGDPHLGNYTFTQDLQINLLDFGCIRHFPPTFIQGVLDLYTSLEKQDEAMMVFAFESWGLKNLNIDLIRTLKLWAEYLYGPLLEDRVRAIDENHSSQKGQEIATVIYQKLQELGGVKPPREFVFMDRAAVGLGSAFMRLKAEANWHQLFMKMLENRASQP